jgi:hypothetical protein
MRFLGTILGEILWDSQRLSAHSCAFCFKEAKISEHFGLAYTQFYRGVALN